jgi:multidrug efflux pump subunit AcrA (membrane-fusion protein)
MADVFSVTAVANPASGLVSGAKTPFTITISGGDVLTTTTTEVVTATVSLTAADGATGSVKVPMTLTKNVATPESVVVTACTDDEGTGRVYTVNAGGLSVSSSS